jgi:hypothetical protein
LDHSASVLLTVPVSYLAWLLLLGDTLAFHYLVNFVCIEVVILVKVLG